MRTAFLTPLTHPQWITLLAAPLGALAQPALPTPEASPPRAAAVAEVAAALAESGRQLEQVRAQGTAVLAQAGEAGQPLAPPVLAATPPGPPPLALPRDAEPLEAELGVGGSELQWFGSEPRADVAQALIVPAGEPAPAQVEELREDLAVFHRILGKAAGEERRRGQEMALGIVVSTFPDLRRLENLYLEGYGAVFLIHVPFPLAAPEDSREEPAPDKPADSLWERTRRELFGGQPARPIPRLPPLDWPAPLPGAQPAPYDARRVEKLRRDLLEALQHGTHLRHVKPEEQLVVVVSGTSAAPAREVRLERRLGRGGAVESRREERVVGAIATRGQTLVFRVKKADADALAKGQINLDEFRQRVSVRQY